MTYNCNKTTISGIIKTILLILFLAFSKNEIYAQDTWQQVDGPYGGNIFCLFSNSNYVFAGTNDGVFKRLKTGIVWEKGSSTLNKLQINCGISLSNDWIIIGCEYGGLYRSKDNGATWTLIGFEGNSVTSISIAPDGKIYLTSDGSIYSSTSKGDFWSLIKQSYYPNGASVATGIATLGNGILFYTDYNIDDLMKSTDDGVTWKTCTIHIDNDYDTYHIQGKILKDSENNIYFWGTSGIYGKDTTWTDLVKSSDQGITWSRFNLQNTKNQIGSLFKMDSTYFFGQGYDIYVYDFSQLGLYKSIGGRNWNKCILGPFPTSTVTSILKNDNQLIVGLKNGGIYSSIDEGNTWTLEKFNYNSFEKMIFVENKLLASNKDYLEKYSTGLFISNDSVSSWSYSGLGGGTYQSIAYSSKDKIIYAGVSFFDPAYPQSINPYNRPVVRGIYSSKDYGLSWDLLQATKDLIVGGWCGSNSGLAVNNDGWLFAALYVANQTNIYRSTDKGESWELTDLTNITIPEIIITSNNTIFIIDNNNARKRIYRSTDDGNSWEMLWELNLSIHLASTPNGNLYAAVGGNDYYETRTFSEIIKSTDNGNSWEHLYSGPEVEQFSKIIAMDDSRIFALSLLKGILYSLDSGKSWAQLNTGLPSYGQINKVVPNKFPINDLAISNDGYLYCTIDYNGIFKSTHPFLYSSVNTNIVKGWNMVSVPLSMNDMSSTTVFPIKSSNVFCYDNGYQPVDTVLLGKGYWVKYPDNYNVKYTGTPSTKNEINISTGWNLIGPYNKNIPVILLSTTPSNILSSNFFGYNGGYTIPDTLKSGMGYWIKSLQDGVLNIGIKKQNLDKTDSGQIAAIDSKWGRLEVKDSKGNLGALYKASKEIKLCNCDLPPSPPHGIFDVRWSSNRIVENADNNEVIINSAVYPITLKVEGMIVRIKDALGGKLLNKLMTKGETITITNPSIERLLLEESETPLTYELYQNYPNPFNPTTKIKFGLPDKVKVKLEVYNVLGQRVAVLLDKELDAGYHEVEWKAMQYASGMYIYRISAGSFTDVKKLMLMK